MKTAQVVIAALLFVTKARFVAAIPPSYYKNHHAAMIKTMLENTLKENLENLGCRSSSDRFGDPGYLIAGAYDPLALRVKSGSDFFVLLLCLFPDLDFASATNDSNTVVRQEIVGSV